MAEVIALIYYNGRKFEGIEGKMFEGDKRATRLKHGMSMNNLKKKLHDKLKLGSNQLISSVTCRFLVSSNPRQYIGLEVCDTEDVGIMMDTFAQQTFMKVLELYVNIDDAGSSSVPASPDLTNIQLPLHYDGSYGGEEHDSQALTVHLADDGDHNNNFNVDPDAYHSVDDDDERDDDRLLDEDSSDAEGPMAPVSPSSPIHVQVPINVHPGTNDRSTVPFWNDIPHYTYINWDHPDQEPELDCLAMPDNWESGDELYVGLRFDSKEAVQHALKHYAMKIHQSFRVVESKPTVYYVKCPNSTEEHPCPWRMRAILSKRSTKWGITRWGGQHTCVNQMKSQDHSKCSSDFICSCIIGMVKEEPSISIFLIQERVNEMFGYSVSYTKAWKAKQKALAKAFGDWEESYDELSRWLEYMLPFAPGSVYKIVTHEFRRNGVVDPHYRIFSRVFWTFKQCCDAFNYCKPIIQIDGTWLCGKYQGTLLVATTQDGNGNTLPIAFAIVEGETLSAWSWFLRLIHLHVTARQGICLISDRHASIKSAVAACPEWQPPYAHHVYCIRHIASNFNHKFKNKQMKDELVDIAYDPCPYYFEMRLAHFRSEASPTIREWIDNIRKETWSLACDVGGQRYGHMTTNLSETINKFLKGARNLPITSLVKCTYSRLVTYFINRSGQARAELAEGKFFCDEVMKKLHRNQNIAGRFQVMSYDLSRLKFEVQEKIDPLTQSSGMKWRVILNEQYCECGHFQAYKFPCAHVIAACTRVAVNYFQYVDPVYKLENVANAYGQVWNPIGNDLNIPARTGPRIVPDPSTVRGKGRPKSTRIRNEMDLTESQSSNICGHCHGRGHNRAGCPIIAARVNALFDDDIFYST